MTVKDDLLAHEKICAERYKTIEDKFKSVENRLEKMDTRIWAVLILLVTAVVIPSVVNFVKSFG